jgi:hypothetical protein
MTVYLTLLCKSSNSCVEQGPEAISDTEELLLISAREKWYVNNVFMGWYQKNVVRFPRASKVVKWRWYSRRTNPLARVGADGDRNKLNVNIDLPAYGKISDIDINLQ